MSLEHYPFRVDEADQLINDAIREKLYFFVNDLFPVKGFRMSVYKSLTKHIFHTLMRKKLK